MCFSINAYKSEYAKCIESGKISVSVKIGCVRLTLFWNGNALGKIPESSLSIKLIICFQIITLKFVYFVQRCLRIFVTNMVSTNKVVGSGILLLFFDLFYCREEKLGKNNSRGEIVVWRYFALCC